MNQILKMLCVVGALACAAPSHDAASAQGPKEYNFGGRVMIEHGDTLKMVLREAELERLVARLESEQKRQLPQLSAGSDTLVMLVRPDSGFVLLGGKKYSVSSSMAAHFRSLRSMARRDEANPVTKPIVVY